MSATAAVPIERCSRCGNGLATAQEWCHECGAARTVVHRPPPWWVPLAIVATVVALAAVAFVVILDGLSSSATRGAARTPLTPPPARRPSTPAAPPAPAQIPNWTEAATGYTVELAASPSRAAARATALRLLTAGLAVGVLTSSRHPAMTPGRFVVFLGRFATLGQAQAKAAQLAAHGHPAASAVLVAPGS